LLLAHYAFAEHLMAQIIGGDTNIGSCRDRNGGAAAPTLTRTGPGT